MLIGIYLFSWGGQVEFKAHGVFSLHRDGQVIVIEATGPWNLELIRQYAHDVQPVTRELASGGPWGAIVLVRNSVLFTTEAADALREAGFRTAKSSGRIAVAYVISPEVEGALLAPDILRRIYDGLNTWAIFSELDQAMDWMRGQIATHHAAAA
jgi:hypothetical protein